MKTSPPRVSILMPVFNSAAYLGQALRSVSAQTFAQFELVVIDDGSTDGSSRVLREHAGSEPRMLLRSRPNRGLIATRNELLDVAGGEFIAWMDSDDIALPDRLATQLAAFERNPGLSCLGTAAQCIDPDGELLNVERYPLDHDSILAAQRRGGAMRFPTTMMRRSATAALRFREPFRMGEDLDFLIRLSEVGKMANLAEPLYLYRQHLASVCATLGPNWLAYRDAILALAQQRQAQGSDLLERGGAIEIAAPNRIDQGAAAAQIYAEWSQHASTNGNRPLAWKYAKAAVVAAPTSGRGWKAAARLALGAGKRGAS